MAVGTYAAVKVLDPSRARIYDYIRRHNIPQGFEDRQILHSTLIWSRKSCPRMRPEYDVVHRATPKHLHVFQSEGKNRLCLLLDAPTLVTRHNQLMEEHNATYDYPVYQPHVTIGYDVGDFDWQSLPPIEFDILLGDENVRDGNDRTKTIRPKWKLIQKILSEIA